jgi:hypothetical protein
MCSNSKCSLHETCYRFRAIPNPFRQSFAEFVQESETSCNHYLEIPPEAYIVPLESISTLEKGTNNTLINPIDYLDGELPPYITKNSYKK